MLIVNPGEAEGASSGLSKREEGQKHTTREQWSELCLKLSLVLLSTRGSLVSVQTQMLKCLPVGHQLAMH